MVRRRIRKEDEHVNRYVFMLDTPAAYDSGWMVLHRDPSHVSIDPVMVHVLLSSACERRWSLEFSSEFSQHSYIKVEYIITHHQQHPYLVFTFSSCVSLSSVCAVAMENLHHLTRWMGQFSL